MVLKKVAVLPKWISVSWDITSPNISIFQSVTNPKVFANCYRLWIAVQHVCLPVPPNRLSVALAPQRPGLGGDGRGGEGKKSGDLAN